MFSSYAAADAETGCYGGEDADGDLDDPLDGFLLDFHKGLRGLKVKGLMFKGLRSLKV